MRDKFRAVIFLLVMAMFVFLLMGQASLRALVKDNLEISVKVNSKVSELYDVHELCAEPDDEIFTEYLGAYSISHYCSCVECCGRYASGYTASGTVPTEGRTCAMEGLPIGSKVLVAGQILIVEDRFGSPEHNREIDIYVDDHQRALAYGRYDADVYLVK